MKAATHLAFAGLVGVVAKGLGADIGVVGGAALAAGSLVPDIDTTTSGLGRWVKPLSSLVERRFGHRTITHSLLGFLLFALLMGWLVPLGWWVWFCFLLGVASHVLLDAHNVTGVPLLYPLRLEFVSVYDRGLRVAYGSSAEFLFLLAFSVLAAVFVPFSVDGFSPWFHRALAAPYGVVEDYLSWRNEFEVWAELRGTNLLSLQDVSGRFRVIDVFDPDEFLVEDASGRAFSVALQGADIQVRRARAWRGEPLEVSTYQLDVSGRLIADVLSSLPSSALRVFLNAELQLTEVASAVPVVAEFARVEVSGSRLFLRAARPQDLVAFSSFVVASGSVVIRAEYAAGEREFVPELPEFASFKTHVLRLPNLASLSLLLVEVGDELRLGQLLARYLDEAALADVAVRRERERLAFDLLNEELRLKRAEHEQRLLMLQAKQEDALAELERLRFLVAGNAEPRRRLVEAELALRQAEEDVLLEASAWTSRVFALEHDLQLRDLRLVELEEQELALIESQWVRSSVAGLLSEVRVAAVTTEGLLVELVILEQLDE